jgi:Zn-dependent protease with chaperone function
MAVKRCPQCDNPITPDPRFVTWCDKCDWNLNGGVEPKVGIATARRRQAAKAKGERLFAAIADSSVTRPGLSGARAASYVVAGAIHLVTLSVFVIGVYVVVANFPDAFAFIAGIPLLLLGFVLRPRLGGVRPGTVILPADSAPALYGLCGRIATAVGARPVDLIAVDAQFNASFGQVGLRRRRVLSIGLALWNVMDDQQRIAILGHELAHQVNGDAAHGVVVGSALRSLNEWRMALGSPRWHPQSGSIFAFIEALAQVAARQVTRLMRAAVSAVYRFERSLIFQSSQRAEYFADLLATRAGSSAAMIGALDALHLAAPGEQAVVFAARRDEPDIWEAERTYFESLGPMEWERHRRLDARDGTAVDSTHPPTNLRIELLKRRAAQPAGVSLTGGEGAAIAAEMKSGFELVEQQLKERLAH